MKPRTPGDVDAEMHRDAEIQQFREELQRRIFRFEEVHDIPKAHSMCTLSLISLMWLRGFTLEHVQYLVGDLRNEEVNTDKLLSDFFFEDVVPEVKKFQESDEEGKVIISTLLEYMIGSFLQDFRSDFLRLRLGFPKL